METEGRLSLEQIRVFLEGSDGVAFEAKNRAGLYEWMHLRLREHSYDGLGRASKGLVRQYLGKMTGLGRAQVTRLIGRYLAGEEVKALIYRRHQFPSRYTGADSELLAGVDEAHGVVSGPATQKILQREYHDFGDMRYRRLAGISAAHIYNLRRGRIYQQRRIRYQPTRPTPVSIGSDARRDRRAAQVICE